MTSSPRPASLGRRVLPAVALVGVSGALFTQLDHPTGVAAAGTTSAVRAATNAGSVSGTGTASAAAGSASAAAGSIAPATTIAPPAVTAGTLPRRSSAAPTTAAADPAAPATAAAPPATAAAAPVAAAASGSTACGVPVSGPVVDTRWGPVQVAAGFTTDGTLCSVAAVQTPSSHRKSVQINSYAVPVLNQEANAAKSAQIDIVSGATITSDGYAHSLQSVLDTKG